MPYLQLQDLKARITRLEELARGLAEEIGRQKASEDTVLLARERRAYLSAVADALAGADLARYVLARAVRRLEGP